jgi:SNF2 family DNA or RNA helicase
LAASAQRIGLEQAAHLDDEGLQRFGDSPYAKALRERLKGFKGVAHTALPTTTVQAQMRPYQADGFDFLAHLTRIRLGGILPMTWASVKRCKPFSWLAWLKAGNGKDPKPSLVICPASVVHNWPGKQHDLRQT